LGNSSAYCPPGGVSSTLSAEAAVDLIYNYAIQNAPAGGGTIVFSGTTDGTSGIGTGGSISPIQPNDLILGCFSPVNVAGCGGGTSAILSALNESGTEQFVGGDPSNPNVMNVPGCSPVISFLGVFQEFDPGPCRQNPTPTSFQISVSFADGASTVPLGLQLLVSATCYTFSPDTSLFALPSDYCKAVSDFSQTVSLTGFQVFDTNGKFVPNVNLISDSGYTPVETPAQTPVPEPNTVALLAAGLIGIGGMLQRNGRRLTKLGRSQRFPSSPRRGGRDLKDKAAEQPY
jgi:hypothetical protein